MLILCESRAQCEAAPSIGEILALTPEAAWTLQKAGRPYRKLEEFYNESALAAKHSAMFAAELAWFDFTDAFLGRAIPEFGAAGFRPALAASFLLQALFDEFFFASHAITGLLAGTAGPIYYWPAKRPRIQDHLHPNQSVIPSVLGELAGSRARALAPLSPELIPEREGEDSARLFSKQAARSIFRNRPMGEYRQLRHAGLSAYLSSWTKRSFNGRVLVLEGGYDLEPLILDLRRSGVSVDWLTDLLPSPNPEPPDPRLEAALDDMHQQPDFWKPLTHCGLPPNALVEASLSHWLRQLIPQYWRAFGNAQQKFARTQYAAVLTWEAAAGTLSAPILQAAQRASVPSVLYQHGSSARTSGPWWFSWLAHADKLFVYGDGTAAQLARTYPASPHARASLIPVGSARLDALKASMTPGRVAKVRQQLTGGDPRPIALYVPTYFGGYGRATSDAAAYPEVTYFETQQRIFRVFADFPNVRLLYKGLQTVNSLTNPIPDFLAESIPNASLMPIPPRLSEAMFAVDLIIVDHVITALGEALMTDKPVIAYDPGTLDSIPEAPNARDLLRQRAMLATTPDELEAAVRQFLEANDFSPVPTPDKAFQSAYSTRGQSIATAADHIRGLLDQPSTSSFRAETPASPRASAGEAQPLQPRP